MLKTLKAYLWYYWPVIEPILMLGSCAAILIAGLTLFPKTASVICALVTLITPIFVAYCSKHLNKP